MLALMRLAIFASLVLLNSISSPVIFRGCGDSTPSDLPLPPTLPDAGVCSVDTDCPTLSACADVRCLAGTCVTVSSTIDRDRDGFAVVPCGDDCDDANRLVNPGAIEQCNGRDDDCDGVADEGAPPTLTNRVVASLDEVASVARLGDGLVIAVGSGARTVDRLGRIGPLFDVLGGRSIERLETATSPDGRVLVAGLMVGSGGIAHAIITPGTPPTVSAAMELALPGPALDLAVVAHAGAFAMSWTSQDSTGAFPLALQFDVDSSVPPSIVATDSAITALASDGSALAFPDGMSAISFLSPGGSRRTIPITGALLRHGLASGDGFVVALGLLYDGSTTAQAFRVEASPLTQPLGAVLSSPEGIFSTDTTRLALVNGQYVAARASSTNLRLTLFDASGAVTPQDFEVPRATLTPVSIAAVPGLIAVLGATPSSALTTGSDLVLIEDCAPP
jgi:hypothetical protein